MSCAERTFCALVAQCPCQKKVSFSAAPPPAIRVSHHQVASASCGRTACRAFCRSSREAPLASAPTGSAPMSGSSGRSAGASSVGQRGVHAGPLGGVDLGRGGPEGHPPEKVGHQGSIAHADNARAAT